METKVFLSGRKHRLSAAVDYSDGAIVSKIVSKNEAGNITLFAFAEGQYLSEHSAPFDAFIQIIEGKADVIIDGKMNKLEEGEFIIMPADVPHAVKAPERFKMMLIMIKGKQKSQGSISK